MEKTVSKARIESRSCYVIEYGIITHNSQREEQNY